MRDEFTLTEINRQQTGLGLSFLNISTLVRENSDYWTTIESGNGLKLQRNNINGQGRIVNEKRIRIAWGDMKAMRAAFEKLMKPWEKCKRGDILAVQRVNGLYSHYAVYIGRSRVIHYAAEGSDFGTEPSIHEAPFKDFLGCDTSFEILSFSENGDAPKHKRIDLVSDMKVPTMRYDYDALPEFDKYLRRIKGYHIYSPEETVERAKSRIGENKYNLAFNNCEHFALWCKTGVHESTQVEDVMKQLIFGAIRASDNYFEKDFTMTNSVRGII